MEKKEETKNMTIRIPKSIWVKLRRLQEKDKIRSIHEACIEGLKLIIKERR
ncbi:MAG: hypothetical protein JSV50_03410 [Desulfobacteraceae bacterium]|nr:MAG: hypothetical protein JSV50_03410 [Desulfobacteraceae bacterium]